MKKMNAILLGVLLIVSGSLSAQIDYTSHTVFCTDLNVPNEIVFDTLGNLFVANHSYASYSGPYHNTIAKIDPAGNKSVFISGYSWPSGLAIDNNQNLYMTQNNASSVITKITSAGTVSTFASLPHQPGPVTLFDNNNNTQFAIYTVSHWGIKGIQKTDYAGNPMQFDGGSFHGCQVSSDGLFLYVFSTTTNQMFRFNTATAVSELWVSQIQNYEVWASTIGPDNKLYVIGQSNCTPGKKAVYRINGQNSVTEWITNLPGTHEFNDLAFKQNGTSWDLYLSEVAAGGRMDPASNRIIRFTDVFEPEAIQITVDPCNGSFCQGDSATFTAIGLGSLTAGSLQWYVNGVPVETGNIINGLVAWYPFTGNANDHSGYGHHGTVNGATLADDRFGQASNAYSFDGINDFIKINPSPVLDIKHNLTLSAWFQADPSNLNGQTQITWRGDPQGGYDPYSICFTNNGFLAFRRDVSPGNTMNQITYPASAINLNLWHHIAGTYDSASGEMKLYLDGILKTQQTLAGTANYPTSTFWNMIGGVDNGYGQNFKGLLDDVRIYRRALSANEILQLNQNFDTTFTYIPQNGDTVYCVYTSAGTPAGTDTSNIIVMQVNPLPADIGESISLGSLQNGLVAWYPFNGNAIDESGNGHDGIVQGAVLAGDRFGNANKAYYFNNSSIHATVPYLPSFTIGSWFKYTSLTNLYPTICSLGMEVIYAQADGYYGTGNFWSNASFQNNSYGQVTGPFVIDGNWHFAAITFDTVVNHLRFYLDNTLLLDTLNYNNPLFFDYLDIGRSNSPCCGYWSGTCLNGWVDDLCLYNRSLSSSELASIYTSGLSFLAVQLIEDTICNGSSAILTLLNSQPTIQYQLLKSGINFGPPQTGNGDTLTFPITGLTATSSFTIHALNPATGCNRMLDTTLTVTVVPFVPSVSSDTSVCSGNSTVLEAFGGTNYLWSNGATGAQITVSPLTTTTYFVTVTNAEGCSGSDSVLVTVLPGPQPAISGPAAICLGTNNAVYSTEAGMSNYSWTIIGGTITAGVGTHAVTVTWTTLGAQSIMVNYANAQGCLAVNPTSYSVTVNPMAAPTVTGSTNHCVNSGYYVYSTDSGMNNYLWSVSAGATIIWGQGTSDLTVTWDQPGAQWVAVNYTNGSGCTALTPTQLSVTVNPLPGAAGTITGPPTVCAGSTGVSFSTSSIVNTDTYVWTLPAGATIVSGDGTNTIMVDFGANAQSGNITVYGNNLCGNGLPSAPFPVMVSPLPGLAGIPVGEEMVCEGDTGMVYYVVPISNASTYVWEILGGGVITSGNGTNSIRVKFPVAPSVCALTVFGANSCGGGTISPALDITVHAIPDTPEISQNGEMLVSSAPDGNQWFLNGTAIPGATGQSYQPVQTGNYTVQVTLFGCVSEMSEGYYFIMTHTTGYPMLQAKLWPNPNNGVFRVMVSGIKSGPVSLSVINALGVKVHEKRFAFSSTVGELFVETDALPPGVYMVMVEAREGICGLKMVVE